MAAMCSEGDVLLPGDIITDLKESESSGKTILGPGLRREVEAIVTYRPGVLKFKDPNVYWVDSHHKRVRPPCRFNSTVNSRASPKSCLLVRRSFNNFWLSHFVVFTISRIIGVGL